MIPRVAVLLAGYNGHKHLHEQVFSLLNQKGVKVDIFIRVDGKSSIFMNMVIQLTSDYENIHCIKGDVVSSSGMNFYKLILGLKDITYDYYALCDQDDFWSENKLSRACGCIKYSKSLAYSSACTAFYSNGKKKLHQFGSQKKNDFYFQAAGPGCTYVLSKEGFLFLKNFLLENNKLLEVSAHDWLIYFVLRFSNQKWFLDNESNLMYRQHSLNVAGVNSGFFAKLRRLKLLFSGWYVDDLIKLHLFMRSKRVVPNFKNPLELRRSLTYSFVTYIYYHLYLQTRISTTKRKHNL